MFGSPRCRRSSPKLRVRESLKASVPQELPSPASSRAKKALARSLDLQPIGKGGPKRARNQEDIAPADPVRTKRSVDIERIDVDKVLDDRVVMNATSDGRIVDVGNRRDGSPSPDKSSPDRSTEAGGERNQDEGAKSSLKDGGPSLMRCNLLASRESVDVTRECYLCC